VAFSPGPALDIQCLPHTEQRQDFGFCLSHLPFFPLNDCKGGWKEPQLCDSEILVVSGSPVDGNRAAVAALSDIRSPVFTLSK
jgi:hypothetical protein